MVRASVGGGIIAPEARSSRMRGVFNDDPSVIVQAMRGSTPPQQVADMGLTTAVMVKSAY